MEELIPTLQEEGEERIDTLQEGSIIAGVQTINGKAGDLDLKTINGQDILTPGNLSLATTEQLATKQDALTETQLAAVNSGIDSSKVQQIADNTTAIAGKQDQLTQTQLNAVNSGIDSTKVQQIATNAGNITSLQTDKQDKLVAGTNIQIAADGKTISATDTTYTAGTGLTLTGTQFSVTEPVPTGFFTDTQGTQTGEGTAITLNNTADAPIDNVELKGDTYQFTTTGKNKIDYLTAVPATAQTTTTFVTNGFRSVTTSSGYATKITMSIKASTTYTLSWNLSIEAQCSPFVRVYKGTTTTSGHYVSQNVTSGAGSLSFTTDSGATDINIWFYNGSPAEGTTVWTYIQLEENASATSYEPYTAGASPNPSYPQDIQVVTGEQTVKVVGKNIWDPTAYQENHFIAADGTESTNTSTNTWGNVYVPAGTSMAVSATPSSSTSTAIRVHAFTIAGVWKEQVAVLTLTGGNYGSTTFTTPNEPVLLRWCGAKNLASYQLEYSSTATAYEPYKSQSYTIDLGATELAKIGTYQDYIWKDGADWKVHKAVGKVVLDGSESWENWAAGSQTITMAKRVLNFPSGIVQLSNTDSPVGKLGDTHFQLYAQNGIYTSDIEGMATNTGNLYVRINKARLESVDSTGLKAWFSTHNTTVYYALATATDTVITDAALISQLDALASSTTYAPQTNYATSTASPNLPVILTVDVFKNNYAGLLARLNKAGA